MASLSSAFTNNNRLVVGTTKGVFVGTLGDSAFTAAINDVVPDALTVSLEQNYPNPFNPTTVIQFFLPQPDFVTLDIYDVLGKVVARMVADNLAAGKHKFEWTPHQLPSGVYFSLLRTSTFTQTRKLLLIK